MLKYDFKGTTITKGKKFPFLFQKTVFKLCMQIKKEKKNIKKIRNICLKK